MNIYTNPTARNSSPCVSITLTPYMLMVAEGELLQLPSLLSLTVSLQAILADTVS